MLCHLITNARHTLSFRLASCNIVNVSVADLPLCLPALQDVHMFNVTTYQGNRKQNYVYYINVYRPNGIIFSHDVTDITYKLLADFDAIARTGAITRYYGFWNDNNFYVALLFFLPVPVIGIRISYI